MNSKRRKIIKYATFLSHLFKGFANWYFRHIREIAIMSITDIAMRITLKAIDKLTGGAGSSRGVNTIGVSLTCFTASNITLRANNRIPCWAISLFITSLFYHKTNRQFLLGGRVSTEAWILTSLHLLAHCSIYWCHKPSFITPDSLLVFGCGRGGAACAGL